MKNLKILITTPVGYNSAKEIDPWDSSLMLIEKGKLFPAWVYLYYEGYKDIDRLIILVQRERYFRSERNKKYELVNIGGGYIVNLKHNVQYQANHPSK